MELVGDFNCKDDDFTYKELHFINFTFYIAAAIKMIVQLLFIQYRNNN